LVDGRLVISNEEVSYTKSAFYVRPYGPDFEVEELVCRRTMYSGIRSKMHIVFNCAGMPVPFELEFMWGQNAWILIEEDGAPVFFGSRRL